MGFSTPAGFSSDTLAMLYTASAHDLCAFALMSARHRPSAYQSVPNLTFCLQIVFPFELRGLPFTLPEQRFRARPD
jgi:hypothetical protein